MAMMTPGAFARDYVFRWEDGKQTDPAKTHSLTRTDPGNWSSGRVNEGQLIGSNHGVTPIALANYRGVPVAAITQAVMHALTVDEAVQIALRSYYFGCRLDLLTWSAPVAIMMDGAGAWDRVRVWMSHGRCAALWAALSAAEVASPSPAAAGQAGSVGPTA